MRWSILGFVALFGALSLSLLGGGTACVTGDAGAGGTATASSSSGGPTCDTLGQGCPVCEQCAGVGTCIGETEACQNDPGCMSIASCIDGLQLDGQTDLTSCCGPESGADPNSTLIYQAAANCVFQVICPLSCFGKYYACTL